MKKFTAIYVRRSISDIAKGNNSLSITAQKEDCIKYLREGGDISEDSYRIYCDDGKSGKDAEHRPEFQAMMADAKNGLIDKVIVKKYDRFSRNLREFLNISSELEQYGVSVISVLENFDTSTKDGRMMRNNLLNFAEFEREAIAERTKDSYRAKACGTGFFQGGSKPFGYISERRTVNGKTGSVLVPSNQAYALQKAFEIYQNPETSLNDIIVAFQDNDIDIEADRKKKKAGKMSRGFISRVLENSLYVRADIDVYNYFSSKGYTMIDDVSAYDGKHGLFLHCEYQNDGKGKKQKKVGSEFVKVGYHEGLVSSEAWLAVQDKKAHNKHFPNRHRGMHSWLTGLVKCPHCGYALSVIYSENKEHTKSYLYYRDMGFHQVSGCVKLTPTTRPKYVEKAVFNAMKQRLADLEIIKSESESSPEADNIKAETARIDNEINALMDKLAFADTTLYHYIEERIGKLHDTKSELEIKLQKIERKHREIDIEPLKDPLSHWDELSVQDKRNVAGELIDVIYVSDDQPIDIHFSI